MADVVITQGDSIEKAIPAALDHLPLASLVAGRALSFPAADYYGHPRSTQKHENQ